MELEIRTVLAGYDGGEHARDGLRFATDMADLCNARLLVAAVAEYEPLPVQVMPYEVGEVRERMLAATFTEAAQLMGPRSFERRELIGRPAQELHDCAVRERADLLVVGSTHQGPLGRLYPGCVSHQLLHGAPCPVAVAHGGYPGGRFERIAIAFDGSPQSWAALDFAASLASIAGAGLELLHVAPTYQVVDGVVLDDRDVRARHRTRLDAGIDSVADRVTVDGRLLEYGEGPAKSLVEASSDSDLLVTGSRGYGPLGRVFLGSTSTELIRRSGCTVIAVPRVASNARVEAIDESAVPA